MNSFGIFVRKEAIEIIRTWRIWVLPGILLFFALTGPFIARFTPEIITAVAGAQLGGVVLPPATYVDAYAGWVKNLSQIGLFAVIIIYGSIVSGEVRSGTAALVLTKPLGTGLLATAAKAERLDAAGRNALYASMRALNAVASRAALAVGVQCATDVTGFGLLGHASHIARASDVTLRFDGRALPELPGARALWEHGTRTGGAERNEAFTAAVADWSAARPADVALALDPQTSGGLLVAVPPAKVAEYLSAVPASVVIGQVERRGNALIVLG